MSVGVEFNAPAGQLIRVMGSANLVDWKLVEEVTATGDAMHRSYVVTNDVRFFRLEKP